jgi:phosphoglycolate phosphatase
MASPIHDVLLFDLDGTISDPLVGIHRSINYALAAFGYTQIELAECATYVGPPLDLTFAQITTTSTPAHIGELVGKYRERYAELGYAENTLYPGVAETIAELAATGIELAVCTSKRQDFAERILSLFGLREYFSFVNGGDIGIHKHQQIAGLLAQGAVSARSVMIGDRAVDLIAANRNGLYGAGVLWGYGSQQELAAEQPHYLFSSSQELSALQAAIVANH